jgi:hypothetical protein
MSSHVNQGMEQKPRRVFLGFAGLGLIAAPLAAAERPRSEHWEDLVRIEVRGLSFTRRKPRGSNAASRRGSQGRFGCRIRIL